MKHDLKLRKKSIQSQGTQSKPRVEAISYFLFNFFLIISSCKLADFFANFPSQSFTPSRPHLPKYSFSCIYSLFHAFHPLTLSHSLIPPLTRSLPPFLPSSLTHSLQFTNSFGGHSSVTFLVPSIFFSSIFVCLSLAVLLALPPFAIFLFPPVWLLSFLSLSLLYFRDI